MDARQRHAPAPFADLTFRGHGPPPNNIGLAPPNDDSNRSEPQRNGSVCHSCCCRRCATPASLGAVGVSILVVVYAIAGAFAFLALEGTSEDENDSNGMTSLLTSAESKLINAEAAKLRNETVQNLWKITEGLNILYERNWTYLATQEMEKFQDKLVIALKKGSYVATGRGATPATHEWNFASALLYALTLITTIGYGSVTPRSPWGKVVTVLYALVGIPLMLLYLAAVGDALASAFRRLYAKMCICKRKGRKVKKRPRRSSGDTFNMADGNVNKTPVAIVDCVEILQPEDPVRVPIWLCLSALVLYILGGAWLFSKLETWSLLEGSFFCFSALGTIGFGDLLPGVSSAAKGGPTQARMSVLAAAAYILAGMALVAMSFNLIQAEVKFILN